MKRNASCIACRAALLTIALTGLAVLGNSRSAAADDAKRPNILFIFSDDHALQAIGAYGSKINETPQVDRLAASGMLFRNCFVTNSICAPSRATVLTGKFSHLNGQLTNYSAFDGSQQTFPKLLQNAGYQTALIGKWHLKSDPTGFDHWEVLINQGEYYGARWLNPEVMGAFRKAQRAGNGKPKKVNLRQFATLTEGYTTDVISDKCIEWLENRDKNKPFLLMCQHKAPHAPWAPAKRHETLYDDVTIPEPETFFDDYATRCDAARQQVMEIATDIDSLVGEAPANLDAKAAARLKYQRYAKAYLRTIAAIDDNVGRMLDYLDRAGLADNTIVVYSSDQGYYVGEHGWCDKRWMYEESLHMPLVIRWPGVVRRGSVSDQFVQNIDFAPTFLDAAGVAIPSDIQGRSIVPLLKGESPDDWRQSVYYHYYENPGWGNVARHYGVRTDRYKLIHFYQLDQWELYDLEKDPHEVNNVYGDPACAKVVAELKTEIGRLQKLYTVPKPGSETIPESREGTRALEQAKKKMATQRSDSGT